MNPSISEAFEHMALKSSRARKIKAVAKAQWPEHWSKGTRISNALRRITRRTGVKAGPKLYNTLHSRNAEATLIRLRTGHRGLKQYLHRFKKVDAPLRVQTRQGNSGTLSVGMSEIHKGKGGATAKCRTRKNES